MSGQSKTKRSILDIVKLPRQFPTHKHESKFWEALGRTIATFGFLEEALGKAIFSFTATRNYADSEIDEALEKWRPTLEKALADPLGNLINLYQKSVREHSESTITNLDELVDDLRKASIVRNALCHGSWREPDQTGRSVPFFVNRQIEVFDTAVDIPFLQQTQQHVAELVCAVINTVTHMGWQFPGSNSPGKSIIENKA